MTKFKCNIEHPVVSTRLSAQEVVVLDRLAKREDMSRSAFVQKSLRKLVKEECKSLPDPPAEIEQFKLPV